MNLTPLKSQLINQNDDLILAIKKSLNRKKEKLKDGDILVIASKVVAYNQGRLVKVKSKAEFKKIIKKEADKVLADSEMSITLKNKILIPNSGIDNSNTPKGEVVLWPKEPFNAAQQIRSDLIKECKLKKLGIVISDSHCQPLRLGTTGIAIGWAGFKGVQDERGAKDLFKKKMQYTQVAVADNIASAANIMMGETNASIPFVLVRNLDVKWTSKKASEKDYSIDPKECIYKNLFITKLCTK